jgi:ABC-type Zn uptake system ZnuABC Zn-binding protein ZnuA
MLGVGGTMKGRAWTLRSATLALCLLAASSCGQGSSVEPDTIVRQRHGDDMSALVPLSLAEGERLRVVATTNIVGDVLENVGHDQVNLTVLIPRGTDPHAFEPTPQDAVAVTEAHVVIASGAGLEVFLEPLLQSAGAGVPVVELSSGVDLIAYGDTGLDEEGELHPSDEGAYGELDPHTWLDPNNVMAWTASLVHALGTLDPAHSAAYESNAAAYLQELASLDAWIRDQIAGVPVDERRLVTDHASLGYFARQYGFGQVGTVLPGYSTLSEPSARDLAALVRTVEQTGVRAVFVGMAVSPFVSRRVSEDTGIELVQLYVGSLSEPGGSADTYLKLMRYDVTAIVQALTS